MYYLYLSLYIYIYTHILYTYTYSTYIYIYIYIYIYVYVYLYVYVYVCVYIYIYIYMFSAGVRRPAFAGGERAVRGRADRWAAPACVSQDSSKGGAMETRCSGLHELSHGLFYHMILNPHPPHPPPTAPPCNEYPRADRGRRLPA